jgi:hypothetical protein
MLPLACVCLLNIQTIPFAPPARSLVSVESRPFAPNAVLVDADVAVAVGGSDRTGPALVISVTHTRYERLTTLIAIIRQTRLSYVETCR